MGIEVKGKPGRWLVSFTAGCSTFSRLQDMKPESRCKHLSFPSLTSIAQHRTPSKRPRLALFRDCLTTRCAELIGTCSWYMGMDFSVWSARADCSPRLRIETFGGTVVSRVTLPELQGLTRGLGGKIGLGATTGFGGDFTADPGFGGTGGAGDLGCLERAAGLAGTGGENFVTFFGTETFAWVPRLILNLGITTGGLLLLWEDILPFTAANTVGLAKPIFGAASAIANRRVRPATNAQYPTYFR